MDELARGFGTRRGEVCAFFPRCSFVFVIRRPMPSVSVSPVRSDRSRDETPSFLFRETVETSTRGEIEIVRGETVRNCRRGLNPRYYRSPRSNLREQGPLFSRFRGSSVHSARLDFIFYIANWKKWGKTVRRGPFPSFAHDESKASESRRDSRPFSHSGAFNARADGSTLGTVSLFRASRIFPHSGASDARAEGSTSRTAHSLAHRASRTFSHSSAFDARCAMEGGGPERATFSHSSQSAMQGVKSGHADRRKGKTLTVATSELKGGVATSTMKSSNEGEIALCCALIDYGLSNGSVEKLKRF